eukprot:Unigene9873_Nuclearia_a/m.30133 Unigene9873_Nuclearia_a/g.30133  ORF Unigene9873_Nuclearia_a/g.30133 Unigene9873_Nuclearia_a/m.30133 type:complete len:319 (+) Unigene9873_Nuclearia_a:379-1335(+)
MPRRQGRLQVGGRRNGRSDAHGPQQRWWQAELERVLHLHNERVVPRHERCQTERGCLTRRQLNDEQVAHDALDAGELSLLSRPSCRWLRLDGRRRRQQHDDVLVHVHHRRAADRNVRRVQGCCDGWCGHVHAIRKRRLLHHMQRPVRLHDHDVALDAVVVAVAEPRELHRHGAGDPRQLEGRDERRLHGLLIKAAERQRRELRRVRLAGARDDVEQDVARGRVRAERRQGHAVVRCPRRPDAPREQIRRDEHQVLRCLDRRCGRRGRARRRARQSARRRRTERRGRASACHDRDAPALGRRRGGAGRGHAAERGAATK